MLFPVGVERLGLVLLVSWVAGFVTGLAGFGTALVAVGPWLHLLPPGFVPPLAAASSVVAQIASFRVVRRGVRWRELAPYLIGASVGTPLGVAILYRWTASLLRPTVGVLLIGFAVWELSRAGWGGVRLKGNRVADLCVGTCGGLLGGFAGISAPVPVIWLRLRGGTPDAQRAIYQPFSLLVLSWALVFMVLAGFMTLPVLLTAAFCVPVIIQASRFGARTYRKLGRAQFRHLVLILLIVSGLSLLYQRSG